jgi:hypothetical protein
MHPENPAALPASNPGKRPWMIFQALQPIHAVCPAWNLSEADQVTRSLAADQARNHRAVCPDAVQRIGRDQDVHTVACAILVRMRNLVIFRCGKQLHNCG